MAKKDRSVGPVFFIDYPRPACGERSAFVAAAPSIRRRWYALPLHVKQLDVEHQRRVRRNGAAGAAGAVAQCRRDDQGTLAADFHGGDAFIPTGDHPALPDWKLERLVAIDRRVEFLALLPVLVEPAGVMHDANLTGLRRSSGADRAVNHLQA